MKTTKNHNIQPIDPLVSEFYETLTIIEVRQWITGLVEWYNHEHRQSAIGFVTPVQGHEGLDEQLLINRKAIYEATYAKNPERWSGCARNWQRIEKVHLNPDKPKNRS
jgi:hypothetical protein